ncbi:MAG: hypothetical protein ACXVV5_24500 [Solirubrobacteraceae bacterium]
MRFGNQAVTFTDDIILDQTKPTVTSAIANATATATPAAPSTGFMHASMSRPMTYRIQIAAKDATSGVAKMQFAVKSTRHPSGLRKFQRTTRYGGLRAPKYVRVRDGAGNYSSWHSLR